MSLRQPTRTILPTSVTLASVDLLGMDVYDQAAIWVRTPLSITQLLSCSCSDDGLRLWIAETRIQSTFNVEYAGSWQIRRIVLQMANGGAKISLVKVHSKACVSAWWWSYIMILSGANISRTHQLHHLCHLHGGVVVHLSIIWALNMKCGGFQCCAFKRDTMKHKQLQCCAFKRKKMKRRQFHSTRSA